MSPTSRGTRGETRSPLARRCPFLGPFGAEGSDRVRDPPPTRWGPTALPLSHGRPYGGAAQGASQPMGEGETRGGRHHEATAGGRGPLRAPDPSLEPEDEALHLR